MPAFTEYLEMFQFLSIELDSPGGEPPWFAIDQEGLDQDGQILLVKKFVSSRAKGSFGQFEQM